MRTFCVRLRTPGAEAPGYETTPGEPGSQGHLPPPRPSPETRYARFQGREITGPQECHADQDGLPLSAARGEVGGGNAGRRRPSPGRRPEEPDLSRPARADGDYASFCVWLRTPGAEAPGYETTPGEPGSPETRYARFQGREVADMKCDAPEMASL